ncbi:hypothetical protein GXW83_13670 [Streptacidiphilus sp. PB12-B1b]|uniref:hypothetical protein n=1 Tax=Streptacidiphilus sp. PB12-B1b TaxID=2705012 RepID=UPI0015FB43FA|nr:hypothetical protein [Streptacidiphilus sp. PB12-B1b]QMU76636.1 hypothetical protein GXW83_13670 [Streptacidiphilus sp. PB12-B1b]
MNRLRQLLRRALALPLVAALAFFALTVPGAAASQAATPRTVTSVCANQAFPTGYIVTAVSNTGSCQGSLLYTVALPSNGAKACTVGIAFPAGWVVIAGTTTGQPQCDGIYETQTINQPYNGILACLGSSLPNPYVITAISGGTYAPCSGQSMTLNQETPGIVACANTSIWNNYVVTAVSGGTACAGYGQETLNPVHSGIVACGQGVGPAGYVVTEVWSSYPGCGLTEGLQYTTPYNGIVACSNSTLPAGWSVTSYRTDSSCAPFEGETLQN